MRHRTPWCRMLRMLKVYLFIKKQWIQSQKRNQVRPVKYEIPHALMLLSRHHVYCFLTGNGFSRLNRPRRTNLKVISSWDKQERVLHLLFELHRWNCILSLPWWNFDRADSYSDSLVKLLFMKQKFYLLNRLVLVLFLNLPDISVLQKAPLLLHYRPKMDLL